MVTNGFALTENKLNELLDAGIAKDKIVLGFHPADIRQYTDFAVS